MRLGANWAMALSIIAIVISIGALYYSYTSGKSIDSLRRADQLPGSKWVLQSLLVDGQQVSIPANVKVTIEFEGNMTRGNGPCNRYFGSYEVKGNVISFGPIGSTKMFCQEVMELESEYFSALGKVGTISGTSNSLQLSSKDKETVLVFAVLQA